MYWNYYSGFFSNFFLILLILITGLWFSTSTKTGLSSRIFIAFSTEIHARSEIITSSFFFKFSDSKANNIPVVPLGTVTT